MDKRIHKRKLMAAALAAVLMFTVFIPASTVAASSAPNTPKEEVVYVSLNADGSVREINVVNIFDLDENGQIIDYGRYESVRNMTTTDKLTYSDGMITVDAGAGKLYYEGKLDRSVMPWSVRIRYYMDGVEYTAEEIAGKSGALKMTVSVTENKECRGSFFDGYALQMSTTLDGGKCRNITADGATFANVGANKQLTYIILPGKGAEITITADVIDFETDGFSINGIPLSLSVEVDDTELTSAIAQLVDAIERLDDGAGELYDGTSELHGSADAALSDGVDALRGGIEAIKDGAGKLLTGGEALEDGTSELYAGADALDAGVRSLNDGIKQIKDALDALNASSPELTEGSAAVKEALTQINDALSGVSATADELAKLTAASGAIKGGIDLLVTGTTALREATGYDAYRKMMLGAGLDVDELSTKNSEAAAGLLAKLAGLRLEIASMKAEGLDTTELEAEAEETETLASLLIENNANILGMRTYLSSLRISVDAVTVGALAIQMSYAEFDASINELVSTLEVLVYRMSELSAGVNMLVSEYEKLDTGIGEYTAAVAKIAAGYREAADGAERLAGSTGALKSGAEAINAGMGELVTGIAELYEGTGELGDGADELDAGVSKLLDAISQVNGGAGALYDGTSEMRKETSGMSAQVADRIDDMIGSFTGEGMEITSFVSEANTEIKSVQFVIKADGVHAAEATDTTPAAVEELTFWQKLLRLFGLY